MRELKHELASERKKHARIELIQNDALNGSSINSSNDSLINSLNGSLNGSSINSSNVSASESSNESLNDSSNSSSNGS